MNDNNCVLWVVLYVYILSMSICMSWKTSFTNISGANGPILIKFIQLFQWVIQSLNTSFQAILIISQNLVILNFKWYSGLLGALEVSRKIERIEIFLYLDKNDEKTVGFWLIIWQIYN